MASLVLLTACASGRRTPSSADACPAADNVTRVGGGGLCLVIKTFGSGNATPVLYVVLHGDTSAGGPSTSHIAVAQALQASNPGSIAVAMIRPGYFDAEGNRSTGSNTDRKDSYTAENIDAIAAAVQTLKAVHGARRVVLIGHSGGAAISAVMLGRHPGLADGAVLVSCPCNISAWRMTRSNWSPAWTHSESPYDYIDRVPPQTRVVAIAGGEDTNTLPALSRAYVAGLQRHGVDARLVFLPGATHDSAFRSPDVLKAAKALSGNSSTPL